MATNKNITMKQYNGTDYDVLYPKTKVSQVDGAVASVNNVTPDNTGAVKVDTFEQSIKIGKNVDVGTDGGASAVQFHFDGNDNAYTSRIVERKSGALTVEGILRLTQALGVGYGGTGATTAADARTNLGLGELATSNVASIAKGGTGATDRETALGVLSGGGTYSGDLNKANDPGVYWVDLSSCSNGPSTSGYGWLEICKSAADSNSKIQRFTYYQDGDIVVRAYTNNQWYSWCRHSSISLPVSVANGGTGATTAEDARTNLGLGVVATNNVVPIARGGTGATTAEDARKNLGLGSVATNNVVPIARGGTAATTAADACANLGAVKKSGDTMTGNLVNTSTIVLQRDSRPTLYYNTAAGKHKAAVICSAGAANDNGGIVLRGWSSDSSDSKDFVFDYSYGLVLPSTVYGSSLPSAGHAGRIFFKKV